MLDIHRITSYKTFGNSQNLDILWCKVVGPQQNTTNNDIVRFLRSLAESLGIFSVEYERLMPVVLDTVQVKASL